MAAPFFSAGENSDVAVAMLLAEIDDLFFSRGGVRFRVNKHQMFGGHIVDSVGLDVKVVVVADDKCHFKKLLEPITVSDFFDGLKRMPRLSRLAQDLW
jgi:hypothetical protein